MNKYPVIIIENALSSDEIQVLRSDCDSFMHARLKYDPAEMGAAIDPLEEIDLPEDSLARVNHDEYCSLRWKDRSDTPPQDKACISEILFHTLPSHLHRVLNIYFNCNDGEGANKSLDKSLRSLHKRKFEDSCNVSNKRHLIGHIETASKCGNLHQNSLGSTNVNAYDQIAQSMQDTKLYLFNEHYIVKEPNSNISFRWHQDFSEQFMAMVDDNRDIYWSIWCPLDDAYEDNGTIRFLNSAKIFRLHVGNSPASLIEHIPDINGTVRLRADRGNEVNENINNSTSESETSNTAFDDSSIAIPNSATDGLPIVVKAGDIVIFTSHTWHNSGKNSTSKHRRVLYAQYSKSIISGPDRKNTPTNCINQSESADDSFDGKQQRNHSILPLNLAIPCNVTY